LSFGNSITQKSGQRLNQVTDSVASFYQWVSTTGVFRQSGQLAIFPERCFVNCAESRSIGSNASRLLCEEWNRVHRSREPSGKNLCRRQRRVL